MRLTVFVIGLIAMLSAPASAQVLSWQGVGSVRLGMTVAEAERALNAKLGPVALPFSEECYLTGRADGKDEALSYVIENGRIVVISVLPGKQSSVVDAFGIGVGSTETDIRHAYGEIRIGFAPYYSEESEAESAKERARLGITDPQPPPHYWIEAESPDHKRAIIFDTQDHKVTYLSTGFRPAVTAYEECQ